MSTENPSVSSGTDVVAAERRFFMRRRASEQQLDSAVAPRQAWWEHGMEALITGGILLLMALSTANSIYIADWVAEMPDLRITAALAVIVGALGSVRQLRWPLGILLGLLLGAVLVLAQVTQVESLGGQPLFWDRFVDLYYRFSDWFTQAFNAGLTTDNLPFVAFADAFVWVAAFVGAYAVARWRTPWPAMILLGALIAVNISYLNDRQWNLSYGFFLTGAVLLLMRTALLRKMDEWRAAGSPYPEWISLSFLTAALIAIVVILSLSRGVPRPDESRALNDAWSSLAAPFEGLSDDFRRIFSGIDSNRGVPVHSFDDFMVLQGDIDPGDAIVLRVASTEPGLLRGAAYDEYTGRGWVQSETEYGLVEEREPISGAAPDEPGEGTAALPRTTYAARRPVAAQISVERSPEVLFSLGEPLLANKDVQVQALAPVEFTIEFDGDDALYRGTALEEPMAAIKERITDDHVFSRAEIAGYIPAQYGIVEIGLDEYSGRPQSVTLQTEPEQAEVVAIRPRTDRLRAGYTYQLTGDVSTASVDALRGAGRNYPVWIRERYQGGPADMEVPAREALAGMLDRITGLLDVPRSDGEWNPYDLAFAVERYLSNALAVGSDGQIVRDDDGNPRPLYPLTTDIELPPPGEDVVHWFLFKNLDRDGLPIGGYYDYHASAMAVLLQLADVPARIATGFALSGNNFDERTGNYLVRGQDSYTWVQVYFPGYGWVDFDPTPGTTVDETLAGIAGTGPRIAAQRLETPRIDLSPTSQSELDEFQLDELLALLAEQLEPGATAGEAAGLNRWYWLGPVIGVSSLIGIILLIAISWRISLRGLGPVERAWTASSRLARWAGIRAEESTTPLEHAAKIDRALNLPDLATEVARSHCAVNYGRKVLSEEAQQQARRNWKQLRPRLLRKLFRLPGSRLPDAGPASAA